MSRFTWQKSTYSGSAGGGECIEVARWQKSSFSSGGTDDECIELADTPGTVGRVHLRESDAPHNILTIPPAALRALIRRTPTRTG
ncbi:hypothetical protein GCM10010218_30270 [Streptomyces mashuensis]|uniref:DUF397 domain-containing protein n=1 Tax=Streptomyces mashuensis TaxID=33904 RepID=A0A919B2M4_9ACTN|nr:hypothetical protein GCM10010218_30270 [Streptomyces mashuensis]